MRESLKDKTVRGTVWNSVDRVANYGISFLVSVVLARLLSPGDYGLIGLINIFIVVFNTILDGGLSTALIRKEHVDDIDYNTVFYINLGISIFLMFILVIGAPSISNFFKRPDLVPMLRVMSFILIINALSIVQQSIMTRNINFKDQTKISVIANLGSGALGITLAFCGFGVWALVAQQLACRTLCTILFWFFAHWMPKLLFSWERFKELFGFSWKLLVSRLVNSIWGQVYSGMIGKCYSPHTLGLYTRAVQYAQMFSSGVSDVVLKVSLPVMSSIQNDDIRLVAATRKIIKTTMYITFAFMLGMAACAKPLIFVLIGEKWIDCVPMLQIVCLNVIMNPLSYINENLLIVKGKSDKLLLLQIAKIVITVAPLILGIYFGIYWMLVSSAVVSWLAVFLYTYYTNIYYGYSAKDQIKDLSPSLLVSLLMAVPVYAMSFLAISNYLLLPIQVVMGFILLVFWSRLLKIEEYYYISEIVRRYLKRGNA